MPIKVTLGGEPLALVPGSSLVWALAYGVDPSISTLTTTADSAARIESLGDRAFGTGRTAERGDPVGPLTLLIEDPEESRRVEVKGIYVVKSNQPGFDYNTRTLTLADRRWIWAETFVEKSFNIRRRTGDRRLERGDMVPLELAINNADVGYRYETLKDGEPWTAREVLAEVLTILCGEGGFELPASLPLNDTIEGLELHDYGPQALARVLAYLPGVRVYVAHDGIVKVGIIHDGSEEEAFRNAGKPNSGDWSKVRRAIQRPVGGYNVLCDIEAELRFDHVEDRTNATQPRDAKGKEPQWIENVIVSPLLELDRADGGKITQGEAVPLGDFLDAVNAMSFTGVFPAPELTEHEIRQHWLGHWQGLQTKYALRSDQQWDTQRLKVLSAIRTHYRQTYRILPKWVDKIRAILPLRAAVLDYETGTRAPASVYTQYLQKFTQLAYSPLYRGDLATRNDDYADDLRDQGVSPFSVQVLDSDIGLFRIVPEVDQTGLAETYVVGDVDGSLPSADVANVAIFWNQVTLSSAFKIAVILTALKATPNGVGRLHSEKVTVAEAAEALGITAPEAKGPEKDLIQTADTARFAWIDPRAEDIRRSFFEGLPMPRELMVNEQAVRALALSSAASALAASLDRVEGRATYPLHKVEPTGNLRTVTHSVQVRQGNAAVLFTTLNAPGEVSPPSVYALLPEGVRRKVRGLVER